MSILSKDWVKNFVNITLNNYFGTSPLHTNMCGTDAMFILTECDWTRDERYEYVYCVYI